MAQSALKLADWWRALYRRRWIIFYIFLTIFLSVIFFTNRQTPVYLSLVKVKVEEPKKLGEFILWGRKAKGFSMATEVQFIRSPQVMKEVAKRLLLIPEWVTLEQFHWLITVVIPARIWARRVEASNIILIGAHASKPEEAAELANTVAETYLDVRLREKIREARFARRSLEKDLMALKVRLDSAEEALKNFKDREGNIVAERGWLKSKLITLESSLSEFLQKYPSESPAVEGLRQQIKDARDQIKILAGKELELGRLKRVFKYNQRKYKKLRELVAAARITERDTLPDGRVIDSATVPESPLKPNKLLNGFVGALIGLMLGVSVALLLEILETPLETIEEVENFLKLPILGVIPYLDLKRQKEGIRWRLWHKKRQDEMSQFKERLIINFPYQSPPVEFYRGLCTNIQLQVLKKGVRTLLFTSTSPGEGKSITTVNLAITAAQAGLKVLLIDADLHQPILSKVFDLKRKPGLVDCLTGVAKWEDALYTMIDVLAEAREKDLRRDSLDNLKLITSGQSISNPAELLGMPESSHLYEELKVYFDLIVFDAPPVLPFADAAILGSRLDGVIIVYQTAMIAREVLRLAKERLENAGVSIRGVVLNNTKPAVETYSRYASYSSHWYK